MVTSGDRSARDCVIPARTVFVVASDPAMHFGDTRPAFAGLGAVLLEVESREFFGHLKELLEEEAPDLVAGLQAFAAVELKPATLVRARKELARTDWIASTLEGAEFRSHDPGFRRIGQTSRSLRAHVADLSAVLPAGAAVRAREPVVPVPTAAAPPPEDRPTLDADRLAIRWRGAEVALDGGKHRRFRLLQLLLERPGVAISHAVLCGPGNPWRHNRSSSISEAAIKSIVRELKRDLAPLGELPLAIGTQTVDGELRPILKLR